MEGAVRATDSASSRPPAHLPVSLHLAAGALVALGALGMLGVLPLPARGGVGVGALLIGSATLLSGWASRRHGRRSAPRPTVDPTSGALLLLAVTLSLTVVLMPDAAPLVVRMPTGLLFGGAFFVAVRREDLLRTRSIAQARRPATDA